MKTQNPFTGRSSGSLANVTATTYCGQNILKSKPLEVRNPQTAKQVNVRNILAQAAALGKSLSAVSGIAKRSARTGRNTQKTARTALLSAILAKKTGVAPGIKLNPSGISLQGSGISATPITNAQLTRSSGALVINWPVDVPAGGLTTDIASFVVVDMETGAAQSFSNSSTRSGQQCEEEITNASILQSAEIALFLMFDSADGLRYDAVSSVEVTVV